MSVTLNRKKPFGEIHGPWPWKYEQDGHRFAGNGDLYVEPGEADAPPEDAVEAPDPAQESDDSDFDFPPPAVNQPAKRGPGRPRKEPGV